MKEKKLLNQIEDANPEIKEVKERIWDKVAFEIGYNENTRKQSKNNVIKWISAVATILVICFIIPIAINFFKKDDDVVNRFCKQDEYILQTTDQNLSLLSKQYSDLLFFDWVESESATFFYIDKNDQTLKLGVNEVIYNPATDTEIRIDVIFPNYTFEEFEIVKQNLINTINVDGINVLWITYQSSANIIFEYKNYTYFLNFLFEIDENYVQSIVTELLNSNKN